MAKNVGMKGSESPKRGTTSSRTQVFRDSRVGHFVKREESSKKGNNYGSVRNEVKEIIKDKISKHSSTWTELAKR